MILQVAILAIIGLIAFGLTYHIGFFHDNTIPLAYCEKKYGPSDMTHRVEVYFTQGKWLCGLRTMSCRLDGSNCYSIGYYVKGEYIEEELESK